MCFDAGPLWSAERVFTIAKLMKSGAESLGYENHMRFSYCEGMRP